MSNTSIMNNGDLVWDTRYNCKNGNEITSEQIRQVIMDRAN